MSLFLGSMKAGQLLPAYRKEQGKWKGWAISAPKDACVLLGLEPGTAVHQRKEGEKESRGEAVTWQVWR